MRLREFWSDKRVKLEHIPESFRDINGRINALDYILVLEAETTNRKINENIEKDVLEQLSKLSKLSVNNPVVGKKYIPVFAFYVGTHDIRLFGSQKPLELVDISAQSGLTVYEFENGQKYPDERLSQSSYAKLYIFDNNENYRKFMNIMSLKFNTQQTNEQCIKFRDHNFLTEAEARIQHAEDLVFWEGSKGAMRALNALKSLEGGSHEKVTIKWDGSPAIIFGRNEDGEFILTDKSGFSAKRYDGKTKSGEALEDMLLSRSGGKNRDNPDYQAFAARMKSIFDEYESAVPEDFRGYFKGDLLYFSTPPVKNNNYVFKPNVVEYAVDVDSDLGKRIGESKTGVVIHRQMDLEGNESEVKDGDIFQGSEVLVVPPVSVEQPAEVSGEETEKLESIIKQNAQGLDELLNQNTLAENKMKDFPNILYAYTNSKVDTGLEDLGKDFRQWLERQPRISERKKENVKNYIQQHDAAFEALWRVVNAVMQVKNSVIDQFDAQSTSVKQSMAGEKGGEGYVLAHPEGDIKLVPRQTFSRINRAVER